MIEELACEARDREVGGERGVSEANEEASPLS